MTAADEIVHYMEACSRLRRERDEALTALAEYGRHLHDCGARLTSNGFCTCGLDDALAQVPPSGRPRGETCNDACYPDSGGSYACALKRGHDGPHASLWNRPSSDSAVLWDGGRVWSAALPPKADG